MKTKSKIAATALVGLAVGAGAYVATSKRMQNTRKGLKKNTVKAMRAASDTLQNITNLMG